MAPLKSNSEKSNAFHITPPPLYREIAMLLVIVSAQAMVQALLAQGIFITSIIREEFHTSVADATWGPAAYGLTSGTFMLPAGRIGDMYGHRVCLVAALIIIALSSLMAGLSVYAHSFVFYAVCRGLQGVGSAAIVPCALALLGSTYREGPRKNLVFSLYAFGSPAGWVLGCVFSALFAQLAWWPWMFWTTTIVCMVLAAATALVVPQTRHSSGLQDDSQRPKFHPINTLAGVSGLVLFCFAWVRAPATGWQDAECIATLCVGVALCVAFVFLERMVDHPLLPVRELSWEGGSALLVTGLAWSSFGITVFYVVTFLVELQGESLLLAAAKQVPVLPLGLAASLLNTFLMARGFNGAEILTLATVWFVVDSILLATIPLYQLYWKQLFWFFVVAPFAMDLSFPAATLLLSQSVPPERQGIGASLVGTVVYYSQALGLGIAGTVEAYTAQPNTLRGFRVSLYTSIGLSGASLVAAAMTLVAILIRRKEAAKEDTSADIGDEKAIRND
ncbi:hypothetical protein M409DRAFT_63688 [Zasmidium cellare ATCC 36951]|uniref:Major facilitator superfamily (MFS) profile domain-containing protein n=1 Tax=Zasmidium cellare ATCC 36951 TaxID=1080233 RepID=A0A6A6D159_ZASCE|nr:uncharacterized protein M409DRAFT_63688 [Zasmidium cellare ATCC 36951]KAF2171386.1 hypothetical protein M409DRAFT_63688 [Zasmidium cellare ATCC 36951]